MAIYGVMLIVIMILLSTTCSNYNKRKVGEQNIIALHDSLHTVQMLNGDLLAYKDAYIITSREYSEYFDISNAKIAELERKLKSNVSDIVVVEGQTKIDTVFCYVEIDNNDSSIIHFSHSDKWTNIGGEMKINNGNYTAKIDSIRMDVPLVVGFTEDNKCFATSENPYVYFSSVNGALGETRKRKTKSVGFQITAGLLTGYDPIRNQANLSVGIAVGFGFNFLGYTW